MVSRYDEIMKTKPYLPFHVGYLTEEMVQKAKDELGETEEAKAKCIPELRKIIQSEKKLVCPTDDAYLLQFLRARKYNVKKAFKLIENYYEVKKTFGDLYDDYDEQILLTGYGLKALHCLPYRDEEGCVIYIIQAKKWNPDDLTLGGCFQCLTLAMLLCIEDPATQVCGMRIILDCEGLTLKHLRCLTPRYVHLFSRALRNTLPLRFKGIHVYNESTIFQYVYSLLKLFLSEKIKNRFHFHGNNQKQLQKFIPKAILPSEYGGDNTQLCNDWFNNEAQTFFGKYRELTTYGYTD